MRMCTANKCLPDKRDGRYMIGQLYKINAHAF